ncbi:MAG: Ltp family lipoprotein [Oenococcus sp.]|uniref:Ltp family lipoprotein n=1 Tax=Oenococcus sp. TaxID=1979414 RepID=UPI0039E9DE25
MKRDKKPIYKKVWFWILAVIVIIVVTVGLNGSLSSNSSKRTAQNESISSKSSVSVPSDYTAALTKAKLYATTMSMSKQKIYDQLTAKTGENFSQKASQYAVDHLINIDWNKNALEKAKTYQSKMAMSPNAIHDQLTAATGEEFTTAQADYAIQHLNDK